MRLTADLVAKAPSYLNPLREREIQLRGNKIPVIENLGASQDQYDCIDLSDNDLTKLENFPLLHRLRTLLLSNNKIQRIALNLGEVLPNLETLILTNNKITNLSDLDPLAALPKLQRLSLLDNLASKKPHYRLYVINKLPHLKLLDFRKVKPKERAAAEKLFEKEKKNVAASHLPITAKQSSNSIAPSSSSISATPAVNSATVKGDVQAIKDAIKNAKSLEEVTNLEKKSSERSIQ